MTSRLSPTSLLKAPEKKRDEVIVHELLHLRYPNHGRMFHSLLKAYLAKRTNYWWK
ncbi:DUF45 domain-containing protein [Acidobacteria bacterium AH-259-O06]|nr:DUF45 domain-containing protein [Acidobacteria bacterium AH-259-O06]